MTKEAKVAIDNMPTVAYWLVGGGIEVKDVYEQDGENYVRCISNAWHGRRCYHNVKVYYTFPRKTKEPRAYVVICGMRYYLDECLRT